MANNYDDEIDLYGDAAVDIKGGSPNNQTNVSGSGEGGGSSIPTFISEARGGTGIIPPREESPDQLPGLEGVIPKNGDYGAPGQWKTKPVSTVRPSDMPEEGKMFIGGLNWETTEDGMRRYFEQFGDVTHCTIMRDPHTDRSRGFGFLTFRDAAAVNVVMVKEHHLDGKIIDPKRAIPRPDLGTVRNDKLFVRHIPQSMDFYKFKEYFSQFGTVTDSNLMMDRETGIHRGFGFVTYDDPSSTSTALSQMHEWDGQPLEVKLATQKRSREDTYVGDRPYARRGPMAQDGGGMGMGNMGSMGNMGMGGGGGGMSNMGAMNTLGGMGNMGNIGNMGAMGSQQQQGGFDPFAMAQFFKQMGWGQFNPMMLMNQNMMGGGGGMMPGMMDPSMMGMMGGNMGGMGGMGGGMGNMGVGMGNMGGMSNMGGFQSPQGGFAGQSMSEGSSNGGNMGMSNINSFGGKAPPTGPRSQQSLTGGSGSPVDTKPPANAPTGPRGDAPTGPRAGTGPIRSSRAGTGATHHPYR